MLEYEEQDKTASGHRTMFPLVGWLEEESHRTAVARGSRVVYEDKFLFVKDEIAKDPDLTEVHARGWWDKLKELCHEKDWLHGGHRKEPIWRFHAHTKFTLMDV